MELFLIIFAVVVAIVFVLFFIGLLRVREHEDTLYRKIYEQHSMLTNHKERLDAHYGNIVELSKQVDGIKDSPIDYKVETLEERRNKFAYLRSEGHSLAELVEIMGISMSTAKRYEKWREDNKK